MMNTLFKQLGSKPAMNPMQLMGQFRQNPIGILKSIGYNIPENMTNPQQIVQHLVQSGQVGNGKLQQAQQMLSQFMR